MFEFDFTLYYQFNKNIELMKTIFCYSRKIQRFIYIYIYSISIYSISKQTIVNNFNIYYQLLSKNIYTNLGRNMDNLTN